MKLIACLTLGCLVLCVSAQAASFDCGKAASPMEKTICSHPELASLDEQMSAGYRYVLARMPQDEQREFATGQKKWLKATRSTCSGATEKDGGEVCFLNAYSSRIGQIQDRYDPTNDSNITCDGMHLFTEKIFKASLDLGSGSMSPNQVDYQCKGGLSTLPFLKTIASLSDAVRADSGPQVCTGTLIYAQWRYYQFDLLRAGLAPQLMEDTDPNDGMGYFKDWALESPSNFSLYTAFLTEFNRDLPLLSHYYQTQYQMSEGISRELAQKALLIFAAHAAGSYSLSSIRHEGPIEGIIQDDSSTLSILQAGLKALNEPQSPANRTDAYLALKDALYLKRSRGMIDLLLTFLGKLNDPNLAKGDESALFATLDTPTYTKALLDAGENVDFTNSFGKTALYYAIGFGQHDMAKLLLDRGANVNHTYFSANELNPSHNECAITAYLKHTLRTPLMHAAQNSDVAMIQLLLDHGAKLAARDELGFTALDYANLGKNSVNAAFLRSKGAIPGHPTYPQDATGVDLPLLTAGTTERLEMPGYVNRMAESSIRPNLLVASIVPYASRVPLDSSGLTLLSLKDPGKPQARGHIPFIYINDFQLSGDGQTAYLLIQNPPKTADTPAGVLSGGGILTVDVRQIDAPRVINFLPGDFIVFHLDKDAHRLYLQERVFGSENRGILVLSTQHPKPELLCTDPFQVPMKGPVFVPPAGENPAMTQARAREMARENRIVAYSFATFRDPEQILIRDWQGRMLLFSNSNPCHPQWLQTFTSTSRDPYSQNVPITTEAIGSRKLIGFTGNEFVGLTLPPNATSPNIISSWGGSFLGFSINYHLSILAAPVYSTSTTGTNFKASDIAFVKILPGAQIIPLARYHIDVDSASQNPITNLVLTDSQWLYLGGNGFILSLPIQLPR